MDHYCEHSVFSGEDQWNKYNQYTYNCTEGSQSTKAMLGYSIDLSGLVLSAGAGRCIESDVYLLTGKISYDIQVWKFHIIPMVDTHVWVADKSVSRWIYEASISLELDGFAVSAEYFKSSRDRRRSEDEHLYYEYPLKSEYIGFAISYKYRACN